MSQPHIHELGAFDPAMAFGSTAHAFIQLVEGVAEEPDCLPPEEVLRAAQVAFETLEAICGITTQSLMGRLADQLPSEAVSEHRITQEARAALRSPEEEAQHRLDLLRRVSTVIPHEVDLDATDDNDDD